MDAEFQDEELRLLVPVNPWMERYRHVRSVWIIPGITTNISGFPVRAIQTAFFRKPGSCDRRSGCGKRLFDGGRTERLDCPLPVRAYIYLSGGCEYVSEPASGSGGISAEKMKFLFEAFDMDKKLKTDCDRHYHKCSVCSEKEMPENCPYKGKSAGSSRTPVKSLWDLSGVVPAG